MNDNNTPMTLTDCFALKALQPPGSWEQTAAALMDADVLLYAKLHENNMAMSEDLLEEILEAGDYILVHFWNEDFESQCLDAFFDTPPLLLRLYTQVSDSIMQMRMKQMMDSFQPSTLETVKMLWEKIKELEGTKRICLSECGQKVWSATLDKDGQSDPEDARNLFTVLCAQLLEEQRQGTLCIVQVRWNGPWLMYGVVLEDGWISAMTSRRMEEVFKRTGERQKEELKKMHPWLCDELDLEDLEAFQKMVHEPAT